MVIVQHSFLEFLQNLLVRLFKTPFIFSVVRWKVSLLMYREIMCNLSGRLVMCKCFFFYSFLVFCLFLCLFWLFVRLFWCNLCSPSYALSSHWLSSYNTNSFFASFYRHSHSVSLWVSVSASKKWFLLLKISLVDKNL